MGVVKDSDAVKVLNKHFKP
jgi:hypothetical protein